MYQAATITSKRQLTIPVRMWQDMGFQEGQKVILSIDKNALKIESATDLVERLAGSLKISDGKKHLSVDEMIDEAKKEYHSHKQA